MGSIQVYSHKIKLWLEGNAEEWGIPLILVLVGISSFLLGRFSAFEEVRPRVSVYEAPLTAQPPELHMGGMYVALNSGSVYYLPWCAGAQKIPLGRERWFKDKESAERAGYKPAKACKGLDGTEN